MEREFSRVGPSKSKLNQELASVISGALEVLFPMWRLEPRVDNRMVVTRCGKSTQRMDVGTYFGAITWINFRRRLANHCELNRLDETIRRNQPELLGYFLFPGGGGAIDGAFSLVTCWCRQLESKLIAGHLLNHAIEALLDDLAEVVASKQARLASVALLSGLQLPDGVDEVRLSDELHLARLTDEEYEQHASYDIMVGPSYNLGSRFVSVALKLNTSVPVIITTSPNDQLSPLVSDLSQYQKIHEQFELLLRGLHVLKEGRVGIVATKSRIEPCIFPFGGHSSVPNSANPFSFMELSETEVTELRRLYECLASDPRESVRIAVSRLFDSEHRLSPVDSLIDCVIGIETLLKPKAENELAFRVALNYAFLEKPILRRSRFDEMTRLQKIRNQIVHNGFNLKSAGAESIHEQATVAKNCLRDVLKRFLGDPDFGPTHKIDTTYWLNRLFPV